MGAYILSFTAPCRSEDVESMVKVSRERAYDVSMNTCVVIQKKGDKKFKKWKKKTIPITTLRITPYFSQFNGHHDQFISHLLSYI